MNKQEQIRELNYLGHEASKWLKNNSVLEAYNKIFLFCILNVNFCEEMPHNFYSYLYKYYPEGNAIT